MPLKLKFLRQQAGMTLEQLAQQSGLTRSYLSKVERGISTPSIDSAFKLARALGVTVDKLFGRDAQADDVAIVRAAESEDGGGYLSLVAGLSGERSMRAFVLRPGQLPRKGSRKPIMSHHEGEEILYVLSGRLELAIGSRRETLEKGDCVQFNSAFAHKIYALDGTDAAALIVVAARDGVPC